MANRDITAPRAGRIGVLGGTFDPIHHGHLLIAEQARDALQLERVCFIPSARPPHKLSEPVTPAEHRYQMALLATASNPHFSVSRVEIERDGPSYTITTIRDLKAQGFADLILIIGSDMALEFHTWKAPQAILAEAQVVVVPRPGFDPSGLVETLGPEDAARLQFLSTPLIEISSTDIRRRVAEGRSIRYLVPDVVAEYIRTEGLYRK